MGKFLGFNQAGNMQVESDAGVARTVFNKDGELYQGGTKITASAATLNAVLTSAAPFLDDPSMSFTISPHNYAGAAADWTLSAAERLKMIHKPTNANGAVNAIILLSLIRPYIFINGTGQVLTVKGASGTGIAIANGKAAMVMSDGTNVIRLTPDA